MSSVYFLQRFALLMIECASLPFLLHWFLALVQKIFIYSMMHLPLTGAECMLDNASTYILIHHHSS